MDRNSSKPSTSKGGWGSKLLGKSRQSNSGADGKTFVAKPAQKKIFLDTEALQESRRKTQEEREALKDEAVEALPEGYFQEEFESPLFELQGMPPNFQASDLDGIVEDRANVLEIVSERLSKHVLANYDIFVRGINEAASVEADLQVALDLIKGTRTQLASSHAEIAANMAISRQQRQKQGLAQMDATLVQLQQAALLRDQLKEAQEDGEFAACFWLCAQACKHLETLQGLSVTGELFASVNRLYGDTVARLEATLSSICCEFEAAQYCKILEGYGFLGNTGSLGEEVNSCFVGVINTSALKVVRGIVLTRAGLEERARSQTILQEIVKCLPPDLYRQCLARVLMVIFDILASHHRMLAWHERSIEAHLAEMASMQTQRDAPGEGETTAAPGDPSISGDGELEVDAASEPTSAEPRSPTEAETSVEGGSEAAQRHTLDRRKTDKDSNAAVEREDDSGTGPVQSSSHRRTKSFGGSSHLQAASGEAERDPLSESQEPSTLADRLESQAAWGEALMSVSEGLTSGKRWIWDEAARKVATLLSAPAAFQGEHFLQALEWTQSFVKIGEAFSGSQSSSLKDAMQRHSGRFFEAYHTANFQALQTMLEQELWKRLPTPAGRRPNFSAALQGRDEAGGGSEPAFDTASFPEWLAHGNPWKRQDGGGRETPEDVSGAPSEDGTEPAGGRDPESESHANGLPSTSGRADRELTVTTASWRMLQWMRHYAHLMRLLPAECGKIHSACCELFELYFLHVFHCFSGVSLPALLADHARQGGPDELPVRLKNAVVRILTRSLLRVKHLYLPQQQTNGTQGAAGSPATSGPASQLPRKSSGIAAHPSTALSNPGNMYGLQERKLAAESLLVVADQLQAARSVLAKKLEGDARVPDHHSLDTFLQTVKAASDLREVVLRAAARLNLPIGWIPERLSEQNFHLEEPPTKASPWVGVLLNHLRVFRRSLESLGMDPRDTDQLWQYGLQYAAEVVLEGLARAGARGRCTVMGRSAMSLDLQGLQRGLQGVAAGKENIEVVSNRMRLVDAYIKAYYIPWGEELHRWAMTHPEYTQAQILMLVGCIAESNNLKRRDRTPLLAEIESDLKLMH